VLRIMMDRAVGWCRERGLTEMRLHNVGSRESSAAAWDSMGFEVVEQVRVRRLENSRFADTRTDSADFSSSSLAP
jgi:hypothetical protein